jgi:predicted ATPase
MIVSHITLKNWRNFSSVNVALGDRVFIVGPNAAGKSNFLEVFRFLRDIAKSDGGGLQNAIKEAGGLKKIRCLAARRKPDVEVEVHLSPSPGQPPLWQYAIGLTQDNESAKPRLTYERVHHNGQQILDRPNDNPKDKDDPERMTETQLEATFANQEFREVAKFFETLCAPRASNGTPSRTIRVFEDDRGAIWSQFYGSASQDAEG